MRYPSLIDFGRVGRRPNRTIYALLDPNAGRPGRYTLFVEDLDRRERIMIAREYPCKDGALKELANVSLRKTWDAAFQELDRISQDVSDSRFNAWMPAAAKEKIYR